VVSNFKKQKNCEVVQYKSGCLIATVTETVDSIPLNDYMFVPIYIMLQPAVAQLCYIQCK